MTDFWTTADEIPALTGAYVLAINLFASRALALSTAAWPIEPNGRVSSDRTGPLPRLSPQQQLHFSEQPRGNDYQHGQAQNELPGRVDAATALTAAMRAAQPCQGWGRGFESHRPLQTSQ